jgi:hypothetical protein
MTESKVEHSWSYQSVKLILSVDPLRHPHPKLLQSLFFNPDEKEGRQTT